MLANRRLGRQLPRADIHVLTTPADRLAWGALEAYLGLAARDRRVQPRARLAAARS